MKLIPATILLACTAAAPLIVARAADEKTDKPAATKERPVAQRAEEVWPLPVGSEVPPLTLKTGDSKIFDLNAALKKQPTVLIFYRGGWCPFCNAQLSQLQKINGDLVRLGYQILAISPDEPTALEKTLVKDALDYTLLSDNSTQAMRSMGLAYRVDDATAKRYAEAGVNLKAAPDGKSRVLPAPGVFIVDQKGLIQFSYVNPNYRVRLNPELLLTAARVILMDNAPAVSASSMVRK